VAEACGGGVSQRVQHRGAFPLGSDSLDAALLVTVPPGLYTVLVGGVDEQSGIALVEIYAVR
jgi:hypothetical protein